MINTWWYVIDGISRVKLKVKTMFYEENDDYLPYRPPAQFAPYVAESSLSQSVRRAALQEDVWQPPQYPPYEPVSAPPSPPRKPQKKRFGARTAAIVGVVLMLMLVLGTGLFAGWEFASHSQSSVSAEQIQADTSTSTSTTGANTLESQQEAAIANVKPAVVELSVTTDQGQQIGSGVIIDKNGDIVTNNHVVSGGQTIVATLENGNTEKAQLVGRDAADDLAVVRIQPIPNMAVATIGDSSKLTVGQ